METNDIDVIKRLAAFSGMDGELLKTTLAEAKITRFPEGKMIFKRLAEDSKVYWLLNGAVDLLDEKFDAKNRKASDDAARFPIDNSSPHRFTAVTTEESRVLVLERTAVPSLNQKGGQPVAEEPEEEAVDWMSALLSSPLFEFIPPANIQTLFTKFEEIKYEAGDVVISQGEPGDYFYVIQSGRVKVERTVGEKTSLQAELKAGDNFGQDALISDVPRNATVTMTTQGALMRLSEPDFESLLMKPVIESLTREEAAEMVKAGNPKTYILDVRNPREVEEGEKMQGALNVPLLLLRKNLPKLKQDAVYITMCDGGKRSELAAYILNEKGFTAYVMK